MLYFGLNLAVEMENVFVPPNLCNINVLCSKPSPQNLEKKIFIFFSKVTQVGTLSLKVIALYYIFRAKISL